MFATTEKSAATTQVVHRKPAGAFFRKVAGEGFFGSKESQPFFFPPVQAKLEVSHPEDPQEKEADAVAEDVMRMPEPPAAAAGEEKKEKEEAVQRAAEKEKEEEKEIQRSVIPTRAPVYGLISRQEGPGGFASNRRSEEEGPGMEVQAKAFPQRHSVDVMRSRGPPSSPDSTQHARSFEHGLSSSRG